MLEVESSPLLHLTNYVFAPCCFALPRPPPPSPYHSNATWLYHLSVTYFPCRRIEYMDGRGGGANKKRGSSSNCNPQVTVMPILASPRSTRPPPAAPPLVTAMSYFHTYCQILLFSRKRAKYVDGKRKRGVNKKSESSSSSRKKS